MKVDIDPDVWLFSRLLYGRGARAITNLAMALAFLVVGLAGFGRDTAAWSGLSDVLHVDLLLGGALILCILAPVGALTQLINLERRGLLDVIRLCGRSPLRLLLTAFAGSMWMNVVVGAILLVSYLWRFSDPSAALLALLALAAALTVAWLAYGCPPGIANTWIAARRLRRQPSPVVRQRRPRLFARLAWGAPGIGPPEIAAVLPAVSLVEGLSSRRPGVYLCLPPLLLAALMTYSTAQNEWIVWATQRQVYEETRAFWKDVPPFPRNANPTLPAKGPALDAWLEAFNKAQAAENWRVLVRVSALPGAMLRTEFAYRKEIRTGVAPRRINTLFLATLLGALSLGAAVGLVRRSEGPALAGVAAIVSVFAVAVAVRELPLVAYPRLLPAAIIVLAAFAAEERAVLSAPWSRIATGAGAALIAGLIVGHQGGIGWAWSFDTGVTASLALALGILVHELTWRTPSVSVIVRLTIFGALVRSWPSLYLTRFTGAQTWTGAIRDLLKQPTDFLDWPLVPLVPPAPQYFELVALGTLFAIAAFLHSRRRQHAVENRTA